MTCATAQRAAGILLLRAPQDRERPLRLTPSVRLVLWRTSLACSTRPRKIRLRQCQQARTRLCQAQAALQQMRYPMDALGIDLAKLTFDVTLLIRAGASYYQQFPNTPAGF